MQLASFHVYKPLSRFLSCVDVLFLVVLAGGGRSRLSTNAVGSAIPVQQCGEGAVAAVAS